MPFAVALLSWIVRIHSCVSAVHCSVRLVATVLYTIQGLHCYYIPNRKSITTSLASSFTGSHFRAMTDIIPTRDDSTKPNDPTPMDVDPQDVDPVDGGPRITAAPTPVSLTPSTSLIVSTISTAEEAKTCIDQLRSADDCSQRVKAAHQLDAIAKLLGPERTKEVRSCHLKQTALLYVTVCSSINYSFSLTFFQ